MKHLDRVPRLYELYGEPSPEQLKGERLANAATALGFVAALIFISIIW